MALTTWPVIAGAWVLAAGMFVGTVWLMGRWSPLGALWRFLAIVCTILTVVTASALTINRQMGFVATTSDVIKLLQPQRETQARVEDVGAPPSVQPQVPYGPTTPLPAHVAAATGADRAAYQPAFQAEGDGVVRAVWRGPASGARGLVRVWTPPGYSPTDGHTYPVIVFLHGYPGSPDGVIERLKARTLLTDLITAHKMPPAVFVIPDANLGGVPSCADIPGAPQAQTWISRDIPKMVRTAFPNVSDHRQDWLVVGVSSGAYCAGRSALVHPEVWGAAGMMSGYDPPLVGALGLGSAELAHANTLSTMMAGQRSFPAWMYLAGTQSDPDSLAVAHAIVSGPLHPDDRVFTHLSPKGGHNWAQWKEELPNLLTWWASQREPDKPATSPPSSSPTPTRSQVAGDVTARDVPEAIALTPFSLLGVGTLSVGIVLALLTLVAAVLIGPLGHGRRGRRTPVWTRIVALTAAVVATTLAIGLAVNWVGDFYVSLGEVLRDLGLG